MATLDEPAARPPCPWRVYVLSGDPLDDDAIATPVGSYRRPASALGIARNLVIYGELGGWHAQIAHTGINATLYLEPAVVDDEGRPAGIAYRPAGRRWAELVAALLETETP